MSPERREANQSRIQFFRNRCTWLEPSAPVHHEVAEGLTAMSDRWRKADGSVVESPGMADHLVKTRSGWCIKYGANVFHVEQAIRFAAKEIRSAYDGLLRGIPVDLERLESQIQDNFSSVVSHETTGRYLHYARVDHDLVFGTHFIDTLQAARFLISESGLVSAMEPDRPRRQPRPPTSGPSHRHGKLPSKLHKHGKKTGSATGTGAAQKKLPKKPRGGASGSKVVSMEAKAALRVREQELQAFVDSKFRQLRSTYPVLAVDRTLRRRARRVLVEIYLRTAPDGANVPDSIATAVRELRRDLDQASVDRRKTNRAAVAHGRRAKRISNGPGK